MDGVKLPEIDVESPVPRYVQAKKILIDAIRSGTFPRGSKLPSTHEVGNQIRVSLLTAHKAIQCLVQEGWLERQRGHGTFVRENFEQSVAAKACVRVGLLIDSSVRIGNYYHGTLLHALRAGAANNTPGAEIFIHQQNSPASIPNLLADGIVAFHPDRDAFEMLEVVGEKTSIVVLGGSSRTTKLHCVDSANEQGARDAVRHLAELGHRDIAIVNGRLTMMNSLHRYRGYLSEMRERELPIREDYSIHADGMEMSELEKARLAELLQSSLQPTAIIAGAFHLALDILTVAETVGLRVPRDLSVIGFDDPRSAALLNPPLTTVRQPLDEMGRLAMKLVLALIEGQTPEPRRNVLPTELVVRASTASIGGR
jgi:DNA-binding LacI/PurR family transcriptional regulator